MAQRDLQYTISLHSDDNPSRGILCCVAPHAPPVGRSRVPRTVLEFNDGGFGESFYSEGGGARHRSVS